MHQANDPKEVPTIADCLFRYQTTHYERFFMLCVDFKVNREQTNLSEVDSKSPFQSSPNQPSLKLSNEELLSAAKEAGRKYGMAHVARLRCGYSFVMEVDFADTEDITTFLQSLSENSFQECLESQLLKQIMAEIVSVSLDVSLHLVVPLAEFDAAFVTKVTLDNLESCLQTLENGNKFSYMDVMTKERLGPTRRGRIFECVS